MNTLEQTLWEHWPPQKVTVSCDDCGTQIFHSRRGVPVAYNPSAYETSIRLRIRKHEDRFGHDSVTVQIDEKPKAEPVDMAVNVEVNGSHD